MTDTENVPFARPAYPGASRLAEIARLSHHPVAP